MRGLNNRVAIITGGLGDLGYASGVRLVEEGCQVVLFDRLPDDEGKAPKIGAACFRVDIGDEAEVEKACAAAQDRLGPASILVNCAACFIFKSIDATAADWEKICRVNIAGASLMAKHVVPRMKKLGGGSIINVSSVSGFVGQANFATYNATKFAIRGLTKCWAKDLAPFGIRVNTICPGYIHTAAFVKSCQALGKDIEEENQRAAAMHLLNRQGRPEEVAAVVAFLAGDDSSFMTGSDVIVDGGYLAQ